VGRVGLRTRSVPVYEYSYRLDGVLGAGSVLVSPHCWLLAARIVRDQRHGEVSYAPRLHLFATFVKCRGIQISPPSPRGFSTLFSSSLRVSPFSPLSTYGIEHQLFSILPRVSVLLPYTGPTDTNHGALLYWHEWAATVADSVDHCDDGLPVRAPSSTTSKQSCLI
jgi:hypothetical protein